MAFTSINLETADGVRTITLNRPAALNALNGDLLRELRDALLEADRDEGVGAVILTGAGRAFSAGVDLKFLGGPSGGGMSHAEFTALARETLGTIEKIGKPVIAAVRGYAVTGALELVLACDMIVASEGAKFGDTHAKFGLTPVWGGSQRLPRLVGAMKAREILFTSELITAREAERIGLVNRVVPEDQLAEAAREIARKIAANSRVSVRVLKRLVNEGLKVEMREGFAYEDTLSETVPDRMERLSSFSKKK